MKAMQVNSPVWWWRVYGPELYVSGFFTRLTVTDTASSLWMIRVLNNVLDLQGVGYS